MMSVSDKLITTQESRGSQPVGSAHRSQKRAPEWSEEILQSKGFVGGVPLNTETAAVKPRVGSAS